MSTSSRASTANYQRVRIRFRKEGDLRWMGHRDLMRTAERLGRRAGVSWRSSEGFHPKPKMHFPSALALGIEAHGEVMEWELAEPVAPQCLLERLQQCTPPGFIIISVEEVVVGQPQARVRCMRYQFPVPDEYRERVQLAIQDLRAGDCPPLRRPGQLQPLDLLAHLADLELRDGLVCFGLRATDHASAGPRDVLQALGLADLEQHGQVLTRVEVELVS